MKQRSALHAAREQIVWILTLIVSTAVVVQLERLDLAQTGTAPAKGGFDSGEAGRAALAGAGPFGGDGSDLALAQRATALSMDLIAEQPAEGHRSDALATLAELERRIAVTDDPLMRKAAALLGAALQRGRVRDGRAEDLHALPDARGFAGAHVIRGRG